MKSFRFLAIAAVGLGLFAASCAGVEGEAAEVKEAVETVEATTASAETVDVNLEASQVFWVGSKLSGDKHEGYFKLKSGSLEVDNGTLVGGTFDIDIASLTVTDLKAGEGKENLEGHLANEDFFKADEFPTSKFEITGVEPLEGVEDASHKISGNLTLLDVTKNITFNANVAITDAGISAETPQFKINRTDFGMKYGSTQLESVTKDKAIGDEVGLRISLITGDAPVESESNLETETDESKG